MPTITNDFGALNGRVCLWINKNGWMKRSEGIPSSNLILSGLFGGVATIPDSHYAEFLSTYATDVNNGVSLHFTECRGEYFKMYFDVDMVTDDRVDASVFVSALSGAIHQTLQKFYDVSTAAENLLDQFVCAAPETQTEDGKYKNGIHVVLPNMIVDQDMALTMREALVQTAYKTLGTVVRITEMDAWRNIIDSSVYNDVKSGLRMLGACKIKVCPSCKNKAANRKSCMDCAYRGKVDCRRQYQVVGVYNDGKTVQHATDAVKKSIHLAVRMSSIRAGSDATPTTGWNKFEGCPSYVPRKSGGAILTRLIDTDKKTEDEEFDTDQKVTNKVFKSRVNIPLHDKRTQAALQMVRNSHPNYAEVEAREFFLCPSSNIFCLKVQGIGSNFCQNKQADHGSNTVYFCFDQTLNGSFHQRCFCRKDTTEGRIDGRCAFFESRKIRMGTRNTELFWPGFSMVQKRPLNPSANKILMQLSKRGRKL